MRAPASIELLSDGTWECGSTGGEWSPGGCGCGSGGSCGCGGSCGGCGGEGGCGAKSGTGEAPRLDDYVGEIWASPARANIDRAPSSQATPCTPGFCYVGGVRRDGFLKPPNLVCGDEECLECEVCQTTATPVPWYPPPPPPPQPPKKRCPDICLEAAAQVEACVAALGQSPNDRFFNMLQGACKQMADWYTMTCGGIPGCPDVAVPPSKKIRCGPDINDWLVKKINDLAKEAADQGIPDLADDFYWIGLWWIGLGDYNLGYWGAGNWVQELVRKGYFDFSEGGKSIFKSDGCPTRDCGDTATLCGYCVVGDNVEDVAFGAMCSTIFPIEFCEWAADEAAKNKWGRPDTPQAHQGMKAGAEAIDGGSVTAESLCKAIANYIGGMKTRGDCPPCDEKLRG